MMRHQPLSNSDDSSGSFGSLGSILSSSSSSNGGGGGSSGCSEHHSLSSCSSSSCDACSVDMYEREKLASLRYYGDHRIEGDDNGLIAEAVKCKKSLSTTMGLVLVLVTGCTVASVGYSLNQTNYSSSSIRLADGSYATLQQQQQPRQQGGAGTSFRSAAGGPPPKATTGAGGEREMRSALLMNRLEKILNLEGNPKGSMATFDAKDENYLTRAAAAMKKNSKNKGMMSDEMEGGKSFALQASQMTDAIGDMTEEEQLLLIELLKKQLEYQQGKLVGGGNSLEKGLKLPALDGDEGYSEEEEETYSAEEGQEGDVEEGDEEWEYVEEEEGEEEVEGDGAATIEEPQIMGGEEQPDGVQLEENPAMEGGVEEEEAPPPLMIGSAELSVSLEELRAEMRNNLPSYKESWSEHEDGFDMPVLWHVPYSGSDAVEEILSICHGKVLADHEGVQNGHGSDRELGVVHTHSTQPGQEARMYVNVDTSTIRGINRANAMDLIDSDLAEVVVTPLLFQADSLMDGTASLGRIFAMFEHPVDRAVAEYYRSGLSQQISLEEYANGPHLQENFLVRYLSGHFDGEVDQSHVDNSAEIMRTKILVGLPRLLHESMDRFEKFFQWRYTINPTMQETCRESQLGMWETSERDIEQAVEQARNTPAYETIMARNAHDLSLYTYAEQLFEEQAAFVSGLPDDYRNVDATCCQCNDPPTC